MFKTKLMNSSAAMVIGALAAGLVGPAAAQSADEIVVQARKRAESLQNIPVSGNVVSEQEIADFGGITGDLQLGEYLTGVTVDEEGNAEYFIRGAGTGVNPQAASATTQLRNGAEVAGGFGGRAFERMDNFDTRQVEVYRGAQGSLYGRNAVGGVLNTVNTEPKESLEYQLMHSYAFETEELRGEYIYNQPITSTLFFRGGLAFEDEKKGLFYNDFLDEPVANTNFWGARGALKGLHDGWDWMLMVDYGEIGYNNYLSDRYATIDGNTLNCTGAVDSEGNPLPAQCGFPNGHNNPYRQAFDTPGYYFEHTLNGLLRVNVDLPFATLTSVTNVRDRIYEFAFDTDLSFIGGRVGAMFAPCGMGAAAAAIITDMMCERFDATETFMAAQEIRLVSPAENRIQWLVGADARYLTNPTYAINQGADVAAGTLLTNNTTWDVTQDAVAGGLYGSVGFDILEKLNLALSARANVERVSIKSIIRDSETPAGPDLVLNESEWYHNLSPSVTFTYDFDNGLLAFASWAQAFRSGGYNRIIGTAVIGGQTINVAPAFDEELANSYELGLKGENAFSGGPFGEGNTRWSLNAYYVVYNGALRNVTLTSEDPDATEDSNFTIGGLVNAGDAYVQGIELDLGGGLRDPFNLGGRINWQGGITYAEGKFTSGVLEGRELNFVNPWTYQANITYRRPLPFFENTGLGLFFNTNFKYEIDTDNFRADGRPGTDTRKRWNARFGVEGENYGHGWALHTFWENIFDVDYERTRETPTINNAPERFFKTFETRSSVGLRLTVTGGDGF